ncbi:thiamin pyrophosphokinase 1-like [Lineus longissimus]|uniref:thiamin pyrophosphokinase 1-like n=1 Tax=Lineus longissimus TaxID=88925 RepID=UPI002B4CDDE3
MRQCPVGRRPLEFLVGFSTTMANSSNRPIARHDWHPLHCLREDYDEKIGLMILNQPLEPVTDQLKILWRNAAIRGVTDGGINELYSATWNEIDEYLPDFISGDFDSANPKLLELYREKGCQVTKTPCQDQTDFTKGLKMMLEKIKEKNLKVSCIVALGGIGGRFDHTMANTNTMFEAKQLTDLPIYLHSMESLSCTLWKGLNVIHHQSGFHGSWCGLLPIGCSEALVTTTGLKYNLEKGRLKFKELVSTSNQCLAEAKHITVETDEEIVWTMAIR